MSEKLNTKVEETAAESPWSMELRIDIMDY